MGSRNLLEGSPGLLGKRVRERGPARPSAWTLDPGGVWPLHETHEDMSSGLGRGQGMRAAPVISVLLSEGFRRASGESRWCTLVNILLLTFALTFLASFLEPPPRSLALVPLASGNLCRKETGHFQALEREGAKRLGPLSLCLWVSAAPLHFLFTEASRVLQERSILYVAYLFKPYRVACRILVPQSGEPRPLAVKVQSPSPWTARKFSILVFKFYGSFTMLY